MTICQCCGNEIPAQFATEFCDACHDPIKLRAIIQQQKNIIALLGQPTPNVQTKTIASAEQIEAQTAVVTFRFLGKGKPRPYDFGQCEEEL